MEPTKRERKGRTQIAKKVCTHVCEQFVGLTLTPHLSLRSADGHPQMGKVPPNAATQTLASALPWFPLRLTQNHASCSSVLWLPALASLCHVTQGWWVRVSWSVPPQCPRLLAGLAGVVGGSVGQ